MHVNKTTLKSDGRTPLTPFIKYMAVPILIGMFFPKNTLFRTMYLYKTYDQINRYNSLLGV